MKETRKRFSIRLSSYERNMLVYLADRWRTTIADVIRRLVYDAYWEETRRKEKETCSSASLHPL